MIRRAVGDTWSGPWSIVDAHDGEARLPSPAEVSGVIVTGSASHVAEQAPWMVRVQAGLAELVRRGVPTLGICFGHQLLGIALGGHSGRNPRGREMGSARMRVSLQDPVLGSAPHRGYDVIMTHLDSVLALPPGAVSLSETAGERHAAIRFGERAWGVQFHPEMDAEIIGYYVEARRAQLSAEGRDADAILRNLRHGPESAGVLHRFADVVTRYAAENTAK
jgi:GMP synthase (glutamine-hydrolysing)